METPRAGWQRLRRLRERERGVDGRAFRGGGAERPAACGGGEPDTAGVHALRLRHVRARGGCGSVVWQRSGPGQCCTCRPHLQGSYGVWAPVSLICITYSMVHRYTRCVIMIHGRPRRGSTSAWMRCFRPQLHSSCGSRHRASTSSGTPSSHRDPASSSWYLLRNVIRTSIGISTRR
jgi:hypothetical protein